MEENTVRIYFYVEGEESGEMHIEEWVSRKEALDFITETGNLLFKIENI